jgi:CheY-like chemotaxis protein
MRNPQARPHVLVVDDEALLGRVLARALGQFAEVDVAQSGDEALRKIASAVEDGSRFDLVVCDVMMPEMSGPELFGRVKAVDPASAKVFVFVTGGATPEHIASIKATGVRCMHKPLDVDSIRALLSAPAFPSGSAR